MKIPAGAFTTKLVQSVAAAVIALPSLAYAAAPKVEAKKVEVQEMARDVSPALRSLAPAPSAAAASALTATADPEGVIEVRPERDGPEGPKTGVGVDRALQDVNGAKSLVAGETAPPLPNFEGLSNQDNFDVLGGRVNPPDPVGAVGPNHYVEMINLVFGVYDKAGNKLLGPLSLGSLWAGFPVTDCALNAGDPIVVYDQIADRWILSQFTSAGTNNEFFNCVAVSQTGDPTGAYYRYAFSSGPNFPDYPKYGTWSDTYVITTREFGPTVEYGIGVYALERSKMLAGQPARVLAFFLEAVDSAGTVNETVLPLVGDGLLPAYFDGSKNTKPRPGTPIPIIGTQDDGGPYGATFDALNIFELTVRWREASASASLVLKDQLPVDSFDSIFPCAPTSRDCLPQPGVTDPSRFLDILSYRQRPTWRLAYRKFPGYEALVTSQSVEAAPGQAGMRWYEVRRSAGAYSVYQQGTYAPADGVNRWMGSVAMDRYGNIGLGYSVVNGVDVFPGIRYTGRTPGDPLGTLPLAEGTIIDGTGVQLTTNSRWGDYTSLNIDPVDDCTMWYVNEYYTAEGQASSLAGWQTRIAAFRLPGCRAAEYAVD